MTLVELVMVIIIMGILAAVAIRSLSGSLESSKVEDTRLELDQLANAIAGNPELHSNGLRSDFGYVGDVGSLPGNLDDLVTSPGYATWKGPYVQSDFSNYGDDYKRDAWGQLYQFGGITIQSTGGTDTLTRVVASSSAALLSNSLTGSLTDAVGNPPGDSASQVRITISYPNGSGGTTDSTLSPSRSGRFSFHGCLPIGNHSIRAVYSVSNDTVEAIASILPNSNVPVNLRFPGSLWASSGGGGGGGGGAGAIEYVPGSAFTFESHDESISFQITNTGSTPITISSLTATYSTTAYYKYVDWAGEDVFESGNPRAASGQQVNFSDPQTIAAGATVEVQLADFRTATNGGSKVDMSGTSITVVLSDGSSITFSTP